MKVADNTNNIIRSFEMRVFHYGMIIAVIFRSIRSIHELLTGSPLPVLLLGLFNLFLLVLLFWLYRKYYVVALIIFFYQIVLTSVVTFNDGGGWNGTVPYILLIMVVFIVITSYGPLQLVTLITYGIVIILLSRTTIADYFSSINQNYSLLSMEINFIFYTSGLIAITLYMKERFLTYRGSVESTNVRLKEATETLAAQTQRLHEHQVELNAIRDNLEAIASVKINEVKTKEKILGEYAFVNAHHVRAPLARVLGLINLIELEEPGHPKSEAFQKIKNQAQEMDTIVRKINDIIS